MSETYDVIVPEHPEIKQLVFEITPRVGDLVRLPDLDGDLHCAVRNVIHNARLPHSNRVAATTIVLYPEKYAYAPRS